MANHLTRSDRAFLASVGRDAHRKAEDAAELADELDAALEAAGYDPAELDPADDDDIDAPSDHPDDIDALRLEVRGAIGALRREATESSEGETTDE